MRHINWVSLRVMVNTIDLRLSHGLLISKQTPVQLTSSPQLYCLGGQRNWYYYELWQ
jgi:hypothetical protein